MAGAAGRSARGFLVPEGRAQGCEWNLCDRGDDIGVIRAHSLLLLPHNLPHPSGDHLDRNGRSQTGSERYINAAQENVNLGEP